MAYRGMMDGWHGDEYECKENSYCYCDECLALNQKNEDEEYESDDDYEDDDYGYDEQY